MNTGHRTRWLAAALERARRRVGKEPGPEIGALVAEARSGVRPLERVLIRDGSKVHVIPVGEIDYIEAQAEALAVSVGCCGTMRRPH